MDLALSDVLAIFSGSLVGFILGVIGGGGSVLAVPLLVYVVGVESPTSPSAPARLRLRSAHWQI